MEENSSNSLEPSLCDKKDPNVISRSNSVQEAQAKKLTKYKLNYVFEKKDDKDRCFSRFFLQKLTLPPCIDLRSNWCEIFDQGELGSCTSNSIAGHVRYVLYKYSGPAVHPSRLFIYYNGRLESGLPLDEDTGLSIKDGCKTIKKQGVCDEELWPYNVRKFMNKPSPECYETALKCSNFSYYCVPQTLNHIKQCLAQKNMISFGARLYEGFMSESTSKTGVVQMPKDTEQEIGSHAMCIVGYNDKTNMFAVANSWSEDWGDNGFCYLPYEYVTNPKYCGDFWFIKYMNDF